MKVKLGEVLEDIINGDWGDEPTGNGDVAVIRTTNFTNNGVINYDNIVYRQIKNTIVTKKQLIYGDIVIEKSGGSDNFPVGRVVYYDKIDNIYLCNNFTSILRVNKDLVVSKYLLYLMLNLYKKGITTKYQTKTTGIRNLKLINYLNNTEINIHDIQTQKEIVAVLDKVTSLISMRKEQLEKLDILVKSKFIEMFGDPVLNPKDWEKKKLGEVCDVRDGTHDSPKFIFNGYPLITSKNIVDNQLVLDKVSYISQEDYDKINKRSKVDKGDILLPMIGTIGNPVIINIEPNFAIKNVALIKFNNPYITNIYIYNMLTSNYIEYVKNILSRGGTQKFIALGDIRKLIIPIPPLDLQNQFAEFVEQVEKNKEKIKSSLNQLETLYSALMQEYFG